MIYLHIGLNKTGTSSMQQFAAMNRPLLAAAGIDYPEVGAARHAHHHLKNALQAVDAGAVPGAEIEAVAAHVAADPAGTFLFSSEGLSLLGEAAVAHLAAALRGHEVRILLYVRDFAACLMSMYNQQAKSGRTVLDFDDFVAVSRAQGRMDVAGKAALWMRHFGRENLRLRSVVPADLVGGDLIADMCAAIGLPDDFVTRTPPESRSVANASVRWEAAELVRAFTRRTIPLLAGWSAEERAAAGAIRRVMLTDATATTDPTVPPVAILRIRRMAEVCETALRAAPRLAPAAQYLTPEQHRALRENYREEIEALRERVPDQRLTLPGAADIVGPRPFLPSFEAIRAGERGRMLAALKADLPMRRLPPGIAAILDELAFMPYALTESAR